MAQLKKIQNTMSDHPELKELLESVNLDNLFETEEEDNENSKGNDNK